MQDDPRRRKPDISLAKQQLNWQPKVNLLDGLKRTVEYFRKELNRINELNSNDPDDLSYEDSFYLSLDEEAKLEKNDYHIEL
jgi:hypothetical protein